MATIKVVATTTIRKAMAISKAVVLAITTTTTIKVEEDILLSKAVATSKVAVVKTMATISNRAATMEEMVDNLQTRVVDLVSEV